MDDERTDSETRELMRIAMLLDAIERLTVDARDRIAEALAARNVTERRAFCFAAQSLLLSAVRVGEQI